MELLLDRQGRGAAPSLFPAGSEIRASHRRRFPVPAYDHAPNSHGQGAQKSRTGDTDGDTDFYVACKYLMLGYLQASGEGGIRTLDTLLGYDALAKRCFRPLSHLTKVLVMWDL